MAGKSRKDQTNANRDTSSDQGHWAVPKPWGELQLQTASGSVIDREVLNAPADWTKELTERLRARNSSVTDGVPVLVAYPVPRNQLLYRSYRELTEVEVRAYMMEELKRTLSTSDFEQFQKHWLEAPEYERICGAIDDFIFQAAVQYGPEIFLLPEVLQRVSDWVRAENGGDKRCEKLGERFALGARVFQGTGRAPLNPWWVNSRSAILREVKFLKKYLPARLPKDRTPSKEHLVAAVLDTIEDNESKFPKLLRIGARFLHFLMWKPELLRSLLEGTITPGNFVGELIWSVTHYKPESSRQLTSRHLSQPRLPEGPPPSDL
jgi:hypothetical protein